MYYNFKLMRKVFALILSLFLFLLVLSPSVVLAQTGSCSNLVCPTGSSRSPLGVGNNTCECVPNATGGDDVDGVFGTIQPPAGVAQYDASAGSGQTGLIVFLSNIIRIGTVVAGIWAMANFILAGWSYVTSSGDPKAHTDAMAKITFSVVGIVIIVGAYTLAAIVGLVVFGDATYILNPRFTGVTGVGGL
jgi:hypothetical protein